MVIINNCPPPIVIAAPLSMDGKLAPIVKFKTRESVFYPYFLNMLTRVLKHNTFTHFHGGKTVVKNFWEKSLIVIHHGLI